VELRCGAARLAPTQRHADVAEEVILELRILQVICSTTRAPPFFCANTASGEFAPRTSISISSWCNPIRERTVKTPGEFLDIVVRPQRGGIQRGLPKHPARLQHCGRIHGLAAHIYVWCKTNAARKSRARLMILSTGIGSLKLIRFRTSTRHTQSPKTPQSRISIEGRQWFQRRASHISFNGLRPKW
jgi:hypothetical protein